MNKASRRDLVRDYKDLKTQAGVYAVRCEASGETWLAGVRNVGSQQNKLWFGLRTGGHPNKAMQAAWTAHGEAGFAFEAVETIDDETLSAIGLADQIKARERHWLATLGATKAVG